MLPYLLILLAFLADRPTKWWAISFFDVNGPTQISSYLFVRETYNGWSLCRRSRPDSDAQGAGFRFNPSAYSGG